MYMYRLFNNLFALLAKRKQETYTDGFGHQVVSRITGR